MNAFLKPYAPNYSYYNSGNPISQNVSTLLNFYNAAYNNYMARFPYRPSNVRFTREELDIYLDNSSAIIKNFVQKKQI